MYRTRCMLAALFLCLFFISVSSTFSQFVKNPTFENTYLGVSNFSNICPTNPNVASDKIRRCSSCVSLTTICTTSLDPQENSNNACLDWYTPTAATPDFFHSGGSNSNYRVPNNGHHVPGVPVDDVERCSSNVKAYAGIWFRDRMDPNECGETGGKVREYIQQDLHIQPGLTGSLLPNKVYKISFWVYCTNIVPTTQTNNANCAQQPTFVTLKSLSVMVSPGRVLQYCIDNPSSPYYGVLPTNTLNSQVKTLTDTDGWGTEYNSATDTYSGKWEKFEANVLVPPGVSLNNLTIGCFEDDFVPETKIDGVIDNPGNCIVTDGRLATQRNTNKYQSYYFIDGVEINEIPCSCDWTDVTDIEIEESILNTINNSYGIIVIGNKSQFNSNTDQYECCLSVSLKPAPNNCAVKRVGIDYNSDGIDDVIRNINLLYPNNYAFEFCINDVGDEIDETIKVNIYTEQNNIVPCTSFVYNHLCKCLHCPPHENDAQTSRLYLNIIPNTSGFHCSEACSTQCCYDVMLKNERKCDQLIEGVLMNWDQFAQSNCPVFCPEPGYILSNNIIKKVDPFWSFGISQTKIGTICIDPNTAITGTMRVVSSINTNTNTFTFCSNEATLNVVCTGSDFCNEIEIDMTTPSGGTDQEMTCCKSIQFTGSNVLAACTTIVHSVIDVTSNPPVNLLNDPLFLYGSGTYLVNSNGISTNIPNICAPDDGRPHVFQFNYSIFCNGLETPCSQEFVVECDVKECCDDIDYLYITTKRNEQTGKCCHTIRGKRKVDNQSCLSNVQILNGSNTVFTSNITNNEFSPPDICTDEGTPTTFTVVFRDANGNVSCIKSLKGECKDCCNDITDLKYEEITSGSEVAPGQCKYKVIFTLKPNSCIRKLISPSTINFNTSSTQGTVNSFEITVTNNQEKTLVFADEAGNEVCKRKVILPCNNCCKDNNIPVTIESYGQVEAENRCCYRIYSNDVNNCFNKVTCFAEGNSAAELQIINGHFEYTSRCVPTGTSAITLVFENTQNGQKCTKILPVNCITCCNRIGTVSIGSPVALDPNRTNCYPISFEVDNTSHCFSEYEIINPSLCFGELPTGRVNISNTSGTKFIVSEMVCVCCQLPNVAQTITIKFYKNNTLVCTKQISIPCSPTTASCCNNIGTINVGGPVAIDPIRNTCYPINFTVDNTGNCFDSYAIWNPGLCMGEIMPSGTIPNGMSVTISNTICVCCEIGQVAKTIRIVFYKNGVEMCEKTVSLGCGPVSFKLGEKEIVPSENENGNTPLIGVVPNPTSGDAVLTYNIIEQSNIALSLYSSNGVKILDLESGVRKVGNHTTQISTGKLTSGTYFIHLDVDGKVFTLPLTVTK